jgi:hypothetical protein
MLPSPHQYKQWSLPTKWSFWAAIIGIPVGLIALMLACVPFFSSDSSKVERNRLLLLVAQELRYNDEWLTSLARAYQLRAPTIPTGSMKTSALMSLIEREHDWVVEKAYGEEKYIYQLAILLKDLGGSLGSPNTVLKIKRFNVLSQYTLHDIHFLNNFLYWYVSPLITENLDQSQRYSLGWAGLPGKQFRVNGIRLERKQFTLNGMPITEYVDYLGLID